MKLHKNLKGHFLAFEGLPHLGDQYRWVLHHGAPRSEKTGAPVLGTLTRVSLHLLAEMAVDSNPLNILCDKNQ